jgi:hypothetical protein
MYTTFWSESLKRRDHSENLGIDGKATERILGKQGNSTTKEPKVFPKVAALLG